MRATLVFTLPEDEREHKYALAGRDALLALEAIDTWARNTLKYTETGPELTEALEHVRTHLIPRELLELLV